MIVGQNSGHAPTTLNLKMVLPAFKGRRENLVRGASGTVTGGTLPLLRRMEIRLDDTEVRRRQEDAGEDELPHVPRTPDRAEASCRVTHPAPQEPSCVA
jgi:hypothetical protein